MAAREALEQQLLSLQARLNSSAVGQHSQPAIAIASSPFANGVLHKMQSSNAELKTQNASLRAEVAELRNAAAQQGLGLGKAGTPGVLLSPCVQYDVSPPADLSQWLRGPG